MQKDNNQNNTIKTLSILLGVALFVILILIGILVYVLVTMNKCDCDNKPLNGGKEIGQKQILESERESITKEQLELAKQEIIENGNYDVDYNGEPIVYWQTNGKKYHIDKNCSAIHKDEDIKYGSVEASFQQGLTEPCRICIKAIK